MVEKIPCFILLLVHLCASLSMSRLSTDPGQFDNSTIYFGLMVSTNTDTEQGVVAGIKAAVERINNDTNFLSTYKLSFVLMESQVRHEH